MEITEHDKNREVTRIPYDKMDDYLAEVKGDSYREYRCRFNNAKFHHIRTEVPLELHLELVSWCNLRCKMCYRSFIPDKERVAMPREMIDEIVSQSIEMGLSSIHLGLNTEPILHPDIIEVLKKLASINPQDFWLRTNGIALTREISELITEIPLTKLSVSIDAATKESYKKIRGGDYDVVIRNLQNFLDIRNKKELRLPFLRVTMVEQEDNRNEIDMFREFWRDKADVIDIQELIDFGYINKQNSMTRQKYSAFECPFTYHYYALSISHDGRMRPCCFANHEVDVLPPTFLGDCSIKEYWNCKATKEFIKMVEDRQYSGSCLDCLASVYKD